MIEVLIDNYPIEFQALRVPRYRGVHSIPIQIYGSEEKYSDIRSLIQSKDQLTMTITGPEKEGGNPPTTTVTLTPLFVHSLRMINDSTWMLELYDLRFELSRRISALDVNMRFADKAVPGTDFSDSLAALKALADSIDVVKNNLDTNAFAQVPSLRLRDDTPLAGHGAREAFDYMGEVGEVDLDVRGGKFRFADRGDIGGSPVLAQLQNLPWTTRPPFLIDSPTYKNLPKRFHIYFQERHTLRLVGTNGVATVSRPAGMAPEAFLELEQVYAHEGKYLTLDELVTAIFGGTFGGITDEAIASSYLTENLDKCRIGGQPLNNQSNDSLTFIGAVKRDWRRLWRISAPQGQIGGWTDFEFGRLGKDGEVSPNAVECEWVELFNVIHAAQGGTFIGAEASKNHPATTPGVLPPSPFVPTWDAGPESMVIRLSGVLETQGGETKAGSIQNPANEAHPGILVDATGAPETLRIGIVTAVDDGNGQVVGFTGFTPVEIKNRTTAHFKRPFEIAIYLTANRRVPQTLDRFWQEDLPAFPNGSVNHHEIMAPILAYRDAVVPPAQPFPDGFGDVLNTLEIMRETSRLRDQWKTEFTLAAEGEGVCESLLAFRDLDIQGPIKQITLEIDSDDTGTFMRTRVEFGNLASPRARGQRQRQKQTFISRNVAGKTVQV